VKSNKHEHRQKFLGSKCPVFSPEQQEELVNYILKMESMFYGMTIKDVRHLAFQLAEKKVIHQFSNDTTLAVEDSFYGFGNRHPELFSLTPEATSAAWVQSFNKINVDKLRWLYSGFLRRVVW
jgi:hypothetical protein